MTDERKSMLAAGIAYSIFGLSYLFSKMALNITEPMILLGVRFLITFIILNILLITGIIKLHFKGKKLLYPILLGILQPVLYFICENYGLKYTTTSFTGIISSISPIFTAILGVFILREKPNLKQWFCIFLSIIGVLLVSIGSPSGKNTFAGCLCLLAAYLIGSLYSIFARKLANDFSTYELTYIMFTVGFIFFTILTFIQHGKETVPLIALALTHPKFMIACLYLGGISSVGAYMLVNYSLGKLSVTRATIFNSFSTIVSVLSGVIFMHDTFTVTSVISFLLILIGVFGVNYFATQKQNI